jgi:hypothetical protein
LLFVLDIWLDTASLVAFKGSCDCSKWALLLLEEEESEDMELESGGWTLWLLETADVFRQLALPAEIGCW